MALRIMNSECVAAGFHDVILYTPDYFGVCTQHSTAHFLCGDRKQSLDLLIFSHNSRGYALIKNLKLSTPCRAKKKRTPTIPWVGSTSTLTVAFAKKMGDDAGEARAA
jgi:hypothetical protein